jgi:hypothetical protein
MSSALPTERRAVMTYRKREIIKVVFTIVMQAAPYVRDF